MRVISKARSSQRSSKRKFEIDSGGAYESRRKRTSNKNEGEHKVDRYCWVCHTEANDEICVTCHRAYHNNCLNKTSTSFSELGVCPECQSKSVSGTELTSNRYFNLDKLKIMLDVLNRRSFGKKKGINKKFVRWPEDDRDKLFKIIDFEILLDNINHGLPYTKTAEFFGDVKFLYHNACIVYGANSDDTKVAENLRREFKSELLDLEACPECYYYLYCDESDQDSFVRLCDSPHDIVWAQLTGHPFWPAKCLKVVKDIAHVRFFGEHEQSNIPINKCYCLSERHPKDKYSTSSNLTNSGPKSQRYKSAIVELLKYIDLYRQKYGDFQFHPHKTPYKPHEKIKKTNINSTEGSSNRNVAQLKLEGIVNEDSDNLINAAAVLEYSEDSLTNDITSPNGNLNTNASAVTSINMTFSADENHLSTENANPVVSSLGPLSSITSTSGTETVHSTGIPSAAANDVSNDSSVHIDSLNNIVNNFSIYTENHSEVDNDVHYLGQSRNEEADDSFNPDIVLPIIMQENPDLKALVQKARYLSDGMIIQLWADVFKQSSYIGALSKLSVQLRKCKSKMDGFEAENHKLKIENNSLKTEIIGLNRRIHNDTEHIQDQEREIQNLKTEIDGLKSDIERETAKNIEAANNAKTIIRSLKSGCSKRIEEMLKAQFMSVIKEKEDINSKIEEALQNEKNKLKNMEEEIKQVGREKKELAEEMKLLETIRKKIEEEMNQLKEEIKQLDKEKKKLEEEKKQMTEELENFRQGNNSASRRDVFTPEIIREYKIVNHCCVCEKKASFVCCLNSSYCSSYCQELHAQSHKKHCSKDELNGNIIKRTVSQQFMYVQQTQGVVTTAQTNSSTNPEASDSRTITSFTHHKKAEIQRVAAAPFSSSPPDNSPGSSSRPHSSKSRRR